MCKQTLQRCWDRNSSQMDCGRIKLLGLHHYVLLCGLKGFHLLNHVSLRMCACVLFSFGGLNKQPFNVDDLLSHINLCLLEIKVSTP